MNTMSINFGAITRNASPDAVCVTISQSDVRSFFNGAESRHARTNEMPGPWYLSGDDAAAYRAEEQREKDFCAKPSTDEYSCSILPAMRQWTLNRLWKQNFN